jgi:ATP adenylyltransferase
MDEEQFTFSDIIQKNARSGAEYRYSGIWKTVGKCVFCDLKKRYVIMEMNGMVLTTNLYPYIDGHLMIIPKRHITHLKQLTEKEWETVRLLNYLSKKILKKLIGVNSLWMLYREGGLGKASQKTVEHLHIHLIPYKDGLVEWKYDTIHYSPVEITHAFKKSQPLIDQLIKRYSLKYSQKK